MAFTNVVSRLKTEVTGSEFDVRSWGLNRHMQLIHTISNNRLYSYTGVLTLSV